jgi:glycosyltransferase involved in cell wall biosynthesis
VTARVWFLTELFYPDQTSTAFILTRIAEHVAMEADVTVICGPERYDEKALAVAAAKLHPRVSVVRVAERRWNKNRLGARLAGSALLTVKMAMRLLRSARPGDTVVIVTNPATLLPLVAEVCRWRQLRLVVIVHDVFPENLVAARIVTLHTMTYRVLRRIYNRGYAAADHLLAIGRDMSDLLRSKTPERAGDRIRVIENWAETETVFPLARRADGPLRLQFAGNFGRVQGLLSLLEAIRRADNLDLEVDFVGGGALRAEMEAFIERHSLRQVRILPPFGRGQQLQVLNDCDIGMVSLAEGMLGVGVPSKAYNILAAGKPILFVGDSRSEIARLIAESDVGWIVPDFGEALVDTLRTFGPSMRPELERMGQRARQLAESRYAEARQLDAYRAIILDQ